MHPIAEIAETLARAGLHLSTTTVGRMLREAPVGTAPQRPVPTRSVVHDKQVDAHRPNHVWHVDLTTVPIGGGFWTTWLPFALPQRWPFCWWVAVVVDQFSRRVMGTTTFKQQPTARMVRNFLGRVMRQAGMKPTHLISDKGPQFDCDEYRHWCGQPRRNINFRYGAVGKHGSIAVVERAIKTIKGYSAQLPVVPLRQDEMQTELDLFTAWYNDHRPHTSLRCRAPNEVYYRTFPAVRRARYEPRSRWLRGSPCAAPWAIVRGKPGARLELHVEFLAGRRHLPVISLRRAA